MSDMDPTEGSGRSRLNRILVAVCTLNESENVVSLIQEILSYLPSADILIVDDQSPDGTAELVERHYGDNSRVMLHVRENERGLGGAIRTAMQYAVDQQYEFLINLDGDFSHDPQQLPRLLEQAEDDSAVDVVIGSRYAKGGQIIGWPIHRKWMSRLVNRFAISCLGLPVSDCSGSMRCYRVSCLRRVGVKSLQINGYAVLEEILLRLVQQGSQLVEVPITFTERQRGKSKLTFREVVRSCSQMIRLSFQR